jgi:hypothetical protein
MDYRFWEVRHTANNGRRPTISAAMLHRFVSVRRNRLLLLLCGAVIVWLAIVMAPAEDRAPHRETPLMSGLLPEAPSRENSSTALPMRETFGRARIDPFAPRSWEPRRPTQVAQPVPETPPPPVPPPLPYRLAGSVQHNGRLTIVLAAGDRIHFVRPGEVIDNVYLVRAVSRDAVTLVYTPLGIEQRITYVAEASPAPASTSSPEQIVAEAPPPAVAPVQPVPVLTPAAAASFPPASPLARR